MRGGGGRRCGRAASGRDRGGHPARRHRRPALSRRARRLRRRGRSGAPRPPAARRDRHAGLPLRPRSQERRSGARSGIARERRGRPRREPHGPGAPGRARRPRRARAGPAHRSRHGGRGLAPRGAIGVEKRCRETPDGAARRPGDVKNMPSFDIVSKVNEQEVDNAFQQAKKEIDQRYDFKGTETTLEKVTAPEKGLKVRSTTEQRLEAARTVLVEKMAKRGVPLRGLKYGAIEQSGKYTSQTLTFVQGIETEKAKALVKMIKDSKLKVQGSIQGDAVRVSGKSRDDLQSVIQMARGKQDELKVDLMFENFRD